ncbi:hypothetical protein AAHE18_05G043700 [Arachis hypogaea]|uniref:Uncharacterized protein n=1 Tax=Arachis hypogaea TaxID=3818 RepID=A0A444WU87_ARAHY|nr:hypothetical protein Ahy_Scaffold1g107043 [Arachis hypogaea]
MGVREISVGGKNLEIHELENVCDTVTGRVLTGSWIWDSALILSQWMMNTAQSRSQPEFDLTGKTVIELGAGAAGLPGLTAAMLGASRVVLTDIEPLILGLSRNVEANNLDHVVHVRKLVWGTDESLGEFDVVLMSDVFFDPDQMGALTRTLKSACGDLTRIWAATEIRPWTGNCLAALADQGFGLVELSDPVSVDLTGPGPKQQSTSFAVFSLVKQSDAGHVPPAFSDFWG